jgi:hypothetical protein
MSKKWRARFEMVSGPYDGLTFTVGHEGVSLGSEILLLQSAQVPDLGDFDDVEFEVGGDGVKLSCQGSFILNGARVTGSREVSPGDIATIGTTEVLLVEYGSGAPEKEVE